MEKKKIKHKFEEKPIRQTCQGTKQMIALLGSE